jgi:hypothetical protein
VTFYGRVEDGHRERERLSGRDVELILRRKRRRRDPQQECGRLRFYEASTADCDEVWWSTFIDRVLAIAVEMGIAIDGPVPAYVRRAS